MLGFFPVYVLLEQICESHVPTVPSETEVLAKSKASFNNACRACGGTSGQRPLAHNFASTMITSPDGSIRKRGDLVGLFHSLD